MFFSVDAIFSYRRKKMAVIASSPPSKTSLHAGNFELEKSKDRPTSTDETGNIIFVLC